MKFSLLMSTYYLDNTLYLKQSFMSLYKQTIKPTEIIIVGDGPIPSKNILLIEELSLKFNVKFIQLEKRVKLGGALRKGLAACSYSLVARFDTDDICEPHRFEIQLQYMASNPNIDICGSYASIIDENGTIKDELKRPLFHKSILQIIWSCPIIHPSVMMRKDKILKLGSYKSLLFSNQEDFELWIRSANNGIKFGNIPKCLIRYRRSEKSKKYRNSILNGLAKLFYGLPAWFSFDRRLFSLFAIIYPVLRPLLPHKFNIIIHKLDPRN